MLLDYLPIYIYENQLKIHVISYVKYWLNCINLNREKIILTGRGNVIYKIYTFSI